MQLSKFPWKTCWLKDGLVCNSTGHPALCSMVSIHSYRKRLQMKFQDKSHPICAYAPADAEEVGHVTFC